jgi:hypothetical protein
MKRQFSILALATVLFFYSCRHQAGELIDNGGSGGGSGGGGGSAAPCDPTTVYFQQQVLPILVSNCAMSGCHDDITRKEGVVLTSYQKVLATGGVRPGNAGESKLYKVLIEPDPGDRMPEAPRNPLNAQQIQLINQWIAQGAKDLVCQSMCDSNLYTYSGAILPLIQNKCQGCHSGASAQGGIDLGTYNAIKARVTDGKLWGSVKQLAGYSPMPKNGAKLSDCELTQISKWINAGALNN